MSVIWWVINIHILSLVDGFGSNLFYMIEYTLTTKPWQHLPNQLATRPLHCDQRLYLVVYRSTGKHQCLFLNHHSESPWSNVHDLWQNLWSYQTGLFDWREFWLILKSRKTFWGEKTLYLCISLTALWNTSKDKTNNNSYFWGCLLRFFSVWILIIFIQKHWCLYLVSLHM